MDAIKDKCKDDKECIKALVDGMKDKDLDGPVFYL